MTSVRPLKRMTPDHYEWARSQGYSDDEIRADGYELPPPERSGLGKLANLIGPWADEIIGGMAAAGSPGQRPPSISTATERFGGTSDLVKEASESYARRYPGRATALQVAGSMVPVLGAAGRAKAAATGAQRLLTSAPAVGAATGAVQGLGRGEGGERLTNAVTDGVLGAAGGAIVGGAVAATRAGAQRLGRTAIGERASNAVRQVLGKPPAARTPAPRETALSVIADKLAADGVDASSIDNAVAALRNGDPELVFNLGGENTTAFMRTIQSIPGRGKAVVQEALDRQSAAVPDVIVSGTERALGKPIPSAAARGKELARQAAKDAKPAYDAIRNQFLSGESIDNVANRPPVAAALRAAREGYLTRGEAVPDGITVDMMDRAKKILDGDIRAIGKQMERGGADGKKTASLRDLRIARRALIEAVDAATDGQYAKARGIAQKGLRKRSAFRDGQRATYQRADKLSSELADATPEERGLLLEGAATDLQERLASSNPQNAASVFDPRTRRNLDLIAKGTDAEVPLRETYQRAGRLQQQNRAATMRGQSTTASTLRGQQELDDASAGALSAGLDAAGKAATGRWGQLAADAARAAYSRYVRGVTSDVAGEAADILTRELGDEASRAEITALIRQALADRAQRGASGALRRRVAGRAGGRGASSLARDES